MNSEECYRLVYTLTPQEGWRAANCSRDEALGRFWRLCFGALFSLKGGSMPLVRGMKHFFRANLLSYCNHYIPNAPPPL
jgi:hypothetical protein